MGSERRARGTPASNHLTSGIDDHVASFEQGVAADHTRQHRHRLELETLGVGQLAAPLDMRGDQKVGRDIPATQIADPMVGTFQEVRPKVPLFYPQLADPRDISVYDGSSQTRV